MKWNDGQFKAIYTCELEQGSKKRSNLLVNAAAGSGKTAVLVERIIQKILPDENAVTKTDIDRLLVVTFTKAAAAEMHQKINRAIINRISQVSDDMVKYEALKRQQKLLANADICNIDAYCIRFVRNNFHLLGLDPNFSPTSGGELEILSDECMSSLFDELYEEDSELGNEFRRIVKVYSNNINDEGLIKIIKSIYLFTTSLPEPEQWLDTMAERFTLENGVEESVWVEFLSMQIKSMLDSAVSDIKDLLIELVCDATGIERIDYTSLDKMLVDIRETGEHDVVYSWGNAWNSSLNAYDLINNLLSLSWDELGGELNGRFKFSSLPTSIEKIKNRDKIPPSNEKLFIKIREVRESVKSKIDTIKKVTASPMGENYEVLTKFLYPDIKAISSIVKRFSNKLYQMKVDRNVLEFSDIERAVYRLLKDNEDVRKIYQEKYDEILIDEYQDVNALQESIFDLISSNNNRFMVGDMKQSIYRFRNADPTIFKHKLDTYKDEENKVITLNLNYRSRDDVLVSVNDVFEKIMSEEVGEMIYDENQRLNTGDKNYENINDDIDGSNKTEVYIIDNSKDESDNDSEEESLSKTEIEARFIAEKIAQLKADGYKIRQEVKSQDGTSHFEYRNIKNSDIAILSDSVKNIGEIYTNEMKKYDIECYIETSGYFGRKEIIIMLSLIKIINNPASDIPLVGIMRSSIFMFTDDELAAIRMGKKGYVIHTVREYSKLDGELSEKCSYFLESLDRWRGYSKYMSTDKLIWTIYEETDFYSNVGTWKDGEEAQANLRLLYTRAKSYEDTGFKGIFNFIKFMERMQSKQGDMTTAKMISDSHDVVRIMTMHKSKGLEFPIVFLCNSSKKFRNFSKNDVVTMHKDMGFGIKYIDYEERYMLSNITDMAVGICNDIEYLSERMRLLYVAMTRAKEKLFVTGVVNDLDKQYQKWSDTAIHQNALDNREGVKSAKSFFDWIVPVALKSDNWRVNVTEYNSSEISETDEAENINNQYEKCDINIDSILGFKYKYSGSINIPAKISVTTAKHEYQKKLLSDSADNDEINIRLEKEIETQIIKKPEFLNKVEKLTPAQIGTATHYVMQTIDDKKAANDNGYIKKHINQLYKSGKLTSKEKSSINIEKLALFYNTDLGKRIVGSNKIYKETPFEIMVNASDIYTTCNTNENIMLQGIIDCFFEEDDGYVLIDYKTDYYTKDIQGIEKIRQKYKTQLDWYARSIEKILQKKVKNKYLYLFSGGDVIEC